MRRTALFLCLLSVVGLAGAAGAQDLASFEKRLTEHRLDNGLTFLIYERPGAPVASFYTYVNVGSAQEVPGITGLAHMFEHMAFKGTTKIGTSNYEAEAEAMAKVDDAYHAYSRERLNPFGSDPEKLAELEKAWKDAQDEAREHVVANEFGEIIDREGGVGLNASTGADRTDYYYSLPANKVELWAHLESERFLDPVLREFYKERDVVMEERRMRYESQPIGRLIEQFVSAAFIAHPYQSLGIGYMSDLQSFTREDAEEFYDTYYTPANMTIAIVGAVEAEEIIPILETYFGRLPADATAQNSRAEADRRAHCAPSGPGAAVLCRGLPPSGGHPPRQRCLRRACRRPVHGPHVASLPEPGAGQEDRRPGSRLQRIPGPEVPEPDDLLRRADTRPLQ